MAESATKSNPLLLDPVAFFRISAWLLGLVALVGIVVAAVQQDPLKQWEGLRWGGAGFQFTWFHNGLHIVLAAAAALFGYGALPPRTVKTMAIAFGATYLLLGVLGFFLWNDPDDRWFDLALSPAVNAVHLLLGGWGLATGLLSKA